MAIEGPLRELGIHDVFQLLDLNRKTGVLRVRSSLRHNEGAVWFDNGVVVYAEIRSNPHPLGDLLVRAGKISDADLNRARNMQRQGDQRRIGDILVSMGVLTEPDLDRQVRFQIEEVIFEMMNWSEGFFSFVESQENGSSVPGDALTRIRIESVLMEGARRIDEWSRMERKIPHVGVVPALRPAEGDNQSGMDLQPTEWEVLALVDGKRDIHAIAAALARSEFDVAKTIFGLEAAGVLTIGDRPRRRPSVGDGDPGVDELLAQFEAVFAGGDLTAGRSVVEVALGGYPNDPRVHVAMARIYLEMHQDPEAEESLRRALRLDTLLPEAHRLLGTALARQGRLQEAVGWWSRWQQLDHLDVGEDVVQDVMEAIRAARALDRFLRGGDG